PLLRATQQLGDTCLVTTEVSFGLLTDPQVTLDIPLQTGLFPVQVADLRQQLLGYGTPGALMIRRLALQVVLLDTQRLQIAATDADHTVQLGQLALLAPLDILTTRVQAQQLHVGTGSRLRFQQLLAFLRRRRGTHHANDPPLLVEHLVAFTDVLRRNTMAIQYHNTLIVDVAIQVAEGQIRAQQPQQHQHSFTNPHNQPLTGTYRRSAGPHRPAGCALRTEMLTSAGSTSEVTCWASNQPAA